MAAEEPLPIDDPDNRPHNLWAHAAGNWAHWVWRGKYDDLFKAEKAADVLSLKNQEIVALPCGLTPRTDL